MVKLLILLGVLAPLFYQGSLATKGCCHTFSQSQEGQLRKLLQEEAGSLRQGMEMMCPKMPSQWHRLNVTQACFGTGTKDDSPAKFKILREGFVAAFKVVHKSGKVTCEKDNCHASHTEHGSFYSKWGCSTSHPYVGSTPLGTFITTPDKRILFPREKFIRDKSMAAWYALPGFEPDSKFLVFHDFAHPDFHHYGDELQVWYGEDLANVSESDNDGQTCVDVFAWYL